FVVKPDETELVLRVDLEVAAQIGVGLVVYVHGGYIGLIHDRKYPLVQIVTAIRTEQPPLVTQKRATKTGGGVSRHVKRRASRDSGSVVDGLLNSSLDRKSTRLNSSH